MTYEKLEKNCLKKNLIKHSINRTGSMKPNITEKMVIWKKVMWNFIAENWKLFRICLPDIFVQDLPVVSHYRPPQQLSDIENAFLGTNREKLVILEGKKKCFASNISQSKLLEWNSNFCFKKVHPRLDFQWDCSLYGLAFL